MRILSITLFTVATLMLWGHGASATTLYYIDGKQVSKGQATIASIKDPRTKVLKVQVNWVRASEKTANLRKASDASLKDIPR